MLQIRRFAVFVALLSGCGILDGPDQVPVDLQLTRGVPWDPQPFPPPSVVAGPGTVQITGYIALACGEFAAKGSMDGDRLAVSIYVKKNKEIINCPDILAVGKYVATASSLPPGELVLHFDAGSNLLGDGNVTAIDQVVVVQ
jgi:hypothetical protein